MEFISPEFLVRYGGIALIALVIFAETGLFFCFFFPGDSLLFITGLMCRLGHLPGSILTAWVILMVAAVMGSQLGFLFGQKVADFLRNKEDRFSLNQKHLVAVQAFCNKHKLMTFVLGRFLPVIRTLVPLAAGAAGVHKHKFILFNLLGAVLWVSVMLFSGYWLGLVFPMMENFIGTIPVSIVVIISMVVMIDLINEMK